MRLLSLYFFAVVGGIFLSILVILIAGTERFTRIAADHILANAIRPSGREMPATAGSVPYRSGDIQLIGGMGQGLSCSLPPILNSLAFPVHGETSPIGLRMRQACAYHDYCYRHGAATYGFTQADCDFTLQAQAFRLCTFIEAAGKPDANGRIKDGACMRDARLVTMGVRIGGSDSFRTLDVRSVPSVEEAGPEGAKENTSTFFEFDTYATKSTGYTVYRVADAPPGVAGSPHRKAIYRFEIRPSGTTVSYSLGSKAFEQYANLAGNAKFLASAPLVVSSGAKGSQKDWFVWWQRFSENETTGRLTAISPGAATPREVACFWSKDTCSTSSLNVLTVQIGRKNPEDPNIDQLRPADLGAAAENGLSLVTLRNHSCLGDVGNAPCIVHVSIKTDSEPKQGIQPQEPLSVNDWFSPKPQSKDRNRYRNFASLPFVFDPPGAGTPVIAWTRREEHYQNDAYLRRAAIDHLIGAKDNTQDTAISQGTVFLKGFSEADEPAFAIGRTTSHPILASLTDATAAQGGSATAMRTWTIPPIDSGDTATTPPAVSANAKACLPGLSPDWLLQPPQILGRSEDGSLAVFTRLRPDISRNWTMAKLEIATLFIHADGSCSPPTTVQTAVMIETSRPEKKDEIQDPIERGRNGFVRISQAPILIADLDGDGLEELILPQGSKPDTPLKICVLTREGACRVPSSEDTR
ncbi:hypothetical protein ACQZ44_00655 [Agrobacterium vitis]